MGSQRRRAPSKLHIPLLESATRIAVRKTTEHCVLLEFASCNVERHREPAQSVEGSNRLAMQRDPLRLVFRALLLRQKGAVETP